MKNLLDLLRKLQDTKSNFESEFLKFAKDFMNNYCLFVNNKQYRFTEIEIYYHHPEHHPDPYVHKNDKQATTGKWYFNGFGLDITFGNKDKNIFGGILIREIKDTSTEEYTNGPYNILKEIFSTFTSVSDSNSFHIEKCENINDKVITAKRIGLKGTSEYKNCFYRFISDLTPEHKFKPREKPLKKAVKDKILTKEEAIEILGYKINF